MLDSRRQFASDDDANKSRQWIKFHDNPAEEEEHYKFARNLPRLNVPRIHVITKIIFEIKEL